MTSQNLVNISLGNDLTAPRHYPNQCWFIISEVLWRLSSEGNPIWNDDVKISILDMSLKITDFRLQLNPKGLVPIRQRAIGDPKHFLNTVSLCCNELIQDIIYELGICLQNRTIPACNIEKLKGEITIRVLFAPDYNGKRKWRWTLLWVIILFDVA